MKRVINRLIYPLMLIGMVLFFVSGCKKDDNDTDEVKSAGLPTLSTISYSEITLTTAKSGGNITSDGGAVITARGVCWSTGQIPTIADNKTTDGTGTGNFASIITGLSNNTTYYVRAYATNINGTGYGNTISFTTIGLYTDPRDGNVYHTVTIGTQLWMVENLRYLPSVVVPDTGSLTKPYYYVYGYNGTNVNDAKATTNYTTYGVLYNWEAAKTAAPTGWHLPTDADWTKLTNYLGGEVVAGGKLKETGTTHWDSPNNGATNESGFTAIPGGSRGSSGVFGYIGNYCCWWSATEENTNVAWYRKMDNTHSNVDRLSHDKQVGFSIRCVKD